MARKHFWLVMAGFLLSATFLFAASIGDGAWKTKVPDKERVLYPTRLVMERAV